MDIGDQLRDIVGAPHVLTDETSMAAYGRDWLSDYVPAPRCVVRPRTTGEVAGVVKACAAARIAIVPSGGRTGLSGGAAACHGEVVVTLERMNTIDAPNTIDRTVRCEAGAITEKLQRAAAHHGLFFPVDFASRGSSQIGGNIATNAGGIRVLRYGNMRDWVLGLTVVTGAGDVLNLNGALFKNNTGYDLRGLMIGSEGTLGIITEAIVKLTAPPGHLTRVLCALPDESKLEPLLREARARFQNLSLFEYFSGAALAIVCERNTVRSPFPQSYSTYALLEFEHAAPGLNEEIEQWLGDQMSAGFISDASLGQNTAQANDLLALRELISSTLSKHYTIHKNDIAVPVPTIGSFLSEVSSFAARAYPGGACVLFGHVADGNIHFNVLKGAAQSSEDFDERVSKGDLELFALVQRYGGTVSAEHGVGLLKKEHLHFTRSPVEIELMRAIKRSFDPHGIMNPGKIFDPA